MKYSLLTVALLASLDAMAATATDPANVLDANDDTPEAIELADTVVRPDYIEIERLANTKEIVVLDRETLQQQGNRTLTDALRQLPTVTVGATGTNQIDIRGQGTDAATRNLQVLLDGAPITSITSHPFSMSYDVVPVEQLERIEIIPGGGSVMYGTGAVGGIVNMSSSLQALKEPRSSLFGEWNSKGYRAGLTAGTTFADNRGAVEFSASKLDRDLYFKDTFANTEYYALGARWNLTPSHRLLVRASHLEEEMQYVNNVSLEKLRLYGRDYVPNPIQKSVSVDARGKAVKKAIPGYLRGDKVLDMVSLSYHGNFNDKVEVVSDAYYNEGYYRGAPDDDQDMEIRGYGLRTKVNWKYMDGGQFLVGIDLLRQMAHLDYTGYETKIKRIVTYNYDYQRDTQAIYAVNTNRWGKWELNEGARYEKVAWTFDKQGKILEGFGRGTSNRYNTAFDLSLAYLYSDTGRLYGRFERGYTLPDGIQISDQYQGKDAQGKKYKYWVPTAAEDEHYNLFELGWRHVFPWTTANVTLWYTQTENQLGRYYDRSNGFTARTVNYLDTDRWGADLSFSQKWGPVTLEEAYSYTMGKTQCHNDLMCKDLGKSTDYTSKGLEKVPQHKFTVRAAWEIVEGLVADATYVYQGKYTNFTFANNEEDYGFMKDYGLLHLGVKYRPNEHWQLYAGVNNVLNEKYFEYGSTGGLSSQTIVPGEGRHYYVGLKAIW